MTKAEFYTDLDILDYHARTDYLSKSMLSELLPPSCPARFKYLYMDGGAKKPTPSLRMGNAVHTLALEPDLFADRYYVLPEGVRKNSRAYKEHETVAAHRVLLPEREYKKVLGMAEALASDKAAMQFLKSPGYIESSIFWHDEEVTDEANLPMFFRCRPDLLRNDNICCDVKTAASVAKDSFERVAFDKHYALSIALTRRGVAALKGKDLDAYALVAVEQEPPHIVEVYRTDMEFEPGVTYADVGETMFYQAVQTWRDCRANNYWPKYNKGTVTTLGVPKYKMKYLDTGEL